MYICYCGRMGGQHKKKRLMKDGLGRAAVERLAANLVIGQRGFDPWRWRAATKSLQLNAPNEERAVCSRRGLGDGRYLVTGP